MKGTSPTAIIEKLSIVPHKSIAKYSSPVSLIKVFDTSAWISTKGTGINTKNL
jgi:hypothetical protein